MKKLRVAVLECDTPIDTVVAKFGTYGDIFKRFLLSGIHQAQLDQQVELEITSWDVFNAVQYPDLTSVDAILISGSKYDSFGNHDWILELLKFVRKAMQTSCVKIVGVCFGHQIIARANGGRIIRNPRGWEIAVNEIQLSSSGKKLFARKTLAIHQMHRDFVVDTPVGFQHLGSSPRCETQGFYVPDKILTLQGHPEFSETITFEIMSRRHDQGIIDTKLWEDGKSRASQPHDGAEISSLICKFIASTLDT